MLIIESFFANNQRWYFDQGHIFQQYQYTPSYKAASGQMISAHGTLNTQCVKHSFQKTACTINYKICSGNNIWSGTMTAQATLSVDMYNNITFTW